jgi:hypothetical protein
MTRRRRAMAMATSREGERSLTSTNLLMEIVLATVVY